MLIMKSGKRRITDGWNHSLKKKLEHSEKKKRTNTWEYWKQMEMKKIKEEYLRRTRKLLKAKLNSKNIIKGINAWPVPLVRYSGSF